MTTKNNTTGFDRWEGYTKTYIDFLIETTQKSSDQTLALSERIAGMWLDTAMKAQEVTLKETETAFQLAEAVHGNMYAQMKTTSDHMVKMIKDLSVS